MTLPVVNTRQLWAQPADGTRAPAGTETLDLSHTRPLRLLGLKDETFDLSLNTNLQLTRGMVTRGMCSSTAWHLTWRLPGRWSESSAT